MKPSETTNWLALLKAPECQQWLLPHEGARRLLTLGNPDQPELVLDRYGPDLLAFAYNPDLDAPLRERAPEIGAQLGLRSIYLKDRSKPDSRDRANSDLIWGENVPEAWVHEGNLRFRIEPGHARNPGLFLDTRALRNHLVQHGCKGRALNLFAYTCSLGIAAAAGGAQEVINVDISRRYLDWGQKQAEANGFGPFQFRVKVMDASHFLDWAIKKREKFESIILDPPAFGRGPKGVFRFAKDYSSFVQRCAACLEPGGRLWALGNYSALDGTTMRTLLQNEFHSAGVKIRNVIPMPTPEDIPKGHGGLAPKGVTRGFGVEIV